MWEEGAWGRVIMREGWDKGSYTYWACFCAGFFHWYLTWLFQELHEDVYPLHTWGSKNWERLSLRWPTIWGQVYLVLLTLIILPQDTVSRWRLRKLSFPPVVLQTVEETLTRWDLHLRTIWDCSQRPGGEQGAFPRRNKTFSCHNF